MRKRFTILLLALTVGTTAAWAQELSFSARADKTTLNVGDPLTLTITLSGDITGIEVQPQPVLQLFHPPRDRGKFQLGPFQITHKGQTFSTEPITVTIEKPAVPPRLGPEGGRFTL